MLVGLILIIYHAISGLDWIGISFILLVSWRSDLKCQLTSDSLQQNAIDAAIDKWTRQLTACRQTTFSHLLWASHKTIKQSWTNKVKITGFIFKNMKIMFIYWWLCGFKVPRISQGKVCTLNRWYVKTNHLSMAYSVSDICTKNYWNRSTNNDCYNYRWW